MKESNCKDKYHKKGVELWFYKFLKPFCKKTKLLSIRELCKTYNCSLKKTHLDDENKFL